LCCRIPQIRRFSPISNPVGGIPKSHVRAAAVDQDFCICWISAQDVRHYDYRILVVSLFEQKVH